WWGGELPERGFWGCSRRLDESELTTLIGATLMAKPAAEIDVPYYHLILIWPVLLHGQPTGGKKAPLQKWVEYFERQGWRDASGGGKGRPVRREFSYEEIVYFLPFFRDFLYGDGH